MKIFQKKYRNLSTKSKWLYVVLRELQRRYKKKTFFRSNEDLAADAGLSLSSLKRAKSELEKTDLIELKLIPVEENTSKKITEYTMK